MALFTSDFLLISYLAAEIVFPATILPVLCAQEGWNLPSSSWGALLSLELLHRGFGPHGLSCWCGACQAVSHRPEELGAILCGPLQHPGHGEQLGGFLQAAPLHVWMKMLPWGFYTQLGNRQLLFGIFIHFWSLISLLLLEAVSVHDHGAKQIESLWFETKAGIRKSSGLLVTSGLCPTTSMQRQLRAVGWGCSQGRPHRSCPRALPAPAALGASESGLVATRGRCRPGQALLRARLPQHTSGCAGRAASSALGGGRT